MSSKIKKFYFHERFSLDSPEELVEFRNTIIMMAKANKSERLALIELCEECKEVSFKVELALILLELGDTSIVPHLKHVLQNTDKLVDSCEVAATLVSFENETGANFLRRLIKENKLTDKAFAHAHDIIYDAIDQGNVFARNISLEIWYYFANKREIKQPLGYLAHTFWYKDKFLWEATPYFIKQIYDFMIDAPFPIEEDMHTILVKILKDINTGLTSMVCITMDLSGYLKNDAELISFSNLIEKSLKLQSEKEDWYKEIFEYAMIFPHAMRKLLHPRNRM